MRRIGIKDVNVCPLTHLQDSEARFQSRIRKFAETHITPYVQKMDQSADFDPELIQKLFDHGLMGVAIPTEYGGKGGTFFEIILATEEVSRIDPAVAVFMDVQNGLVANAIVQWGTDEQKKYFLPKLATDTIGAFSISEKEAGSDAYALTCSATKTDKGYLMNGRKYWVTSAAEADIFLIFAKVQLGSRERLTAFLVEKSKTPGLIVEEKEDKLGIRASSTCKVTLKDALVPEENILGKVGRGQRIALEIITDSRIGIGAQMLGLAQGAFEAALEYAQQRKQFGQLIAGFQGVMFPLAEMATRIQATRLLVYNAARIKTSQSNFGELFYAANMAKYYAGLIAEDAASQAIEVFGGLGYIKSTPVEKFYRDAKIGRIYEGTTNMQLRSIAQYFIKAKIQDS